MSDPSLALQIALVTVLKAGSGVGVGTRVYDSVPVSPTFPYVTVGDDQVLPDDVECADGSEVITRIHAWSRAIGRPEVKTIAGAIRTAVMGATFALSGFTVNEVECIQIQYLEDPDGLTHHAVVEFRFLITHS